MSNSKGTWGYGIRFSADDGNLAQKLQEKIQQVGADDCSVNEHAIRFEVPAGKESVLDQLMQFIRTEIIPQMSKHITLVC